MNKKYKQHVLIEFANNVPCVELFVSDKPIDIDDVVSYLAEHRGFDASDDTDDGVTFVDPPETTSLD